MVSVRWDELDLPEPEGAATASERVEALLTPWAKELIEQAASLSGQSVSDFVAASATSAAAGLLRDEHILRLSLRDSELFLAALEEEPRELSALRKAAVRRRERFGE